ncbi:MAG TPA: hypothetical protein VE251_13765 [Xanthobacteraceae bacterium]|nr:hypothetical protein [Xanthobacteraceae bacterium]
MNFRQKLMACTALLGAWLLVPATAGAQSASEKIERLERQTELLQRQLKELQAELAQTRKKTERVEAKVEAAPARSPAAPPAGTVFSKGPPIPPPPERVKVTLGGFIAAESVWRQHNMVNDIGTAFATTPYPFSPLYNEHEFHGTARQSRISLLVEGNIDPYQKLSGYYESDFLGVGNTSNYNKSNSWAPRLRHAYFTYDNTGWGGWGFHILAGQTWSLATQNQVDMTPRKENIPLTIDANYVVGFNYIRQWQIRGVVDVAPGISLGVSAENPAAIVGASTATAPLGLGGAFASGGIVNGQVVNFVNTGGGGDFLQNVNVTTDQAPDIIEKASFDPGWGHYEIYGLQRFFSDNTLRCAVGACVAGSTTMVGTADNKTTFGAGIGGSVLLPLIPKYLELTASGLYGRGVGRYAAGQLPDVTIAADGSLSLVTGWSAMVGLIGHPWEGLDVYVYAGQEEVAANFFNIGTTLFGLGNPGFSNATCLVTTPASFAGATPADCIANNQRLSEITAGFWQNVYKGDLGRVTVGAQYEYIKRKSFVGIGGDPSTDNNIVMTSLRYYPF